MQLEETSAIKMREIDFMEIIKDLRDRLLIKKLERNEVMTKETLDIFKSAEVEYLNNLRDTIQDDYLYLKHSILADFRRHEDELKSDDIDVVYQQFSLDKFVDIQKQLRRKRMKDSFEDTQYRASESNQDQFLKQIDLSNL